MSRSAERTLELLAAALRSPEPSSLTQLAHRCGLDTSTAARLLDQLERLGWLARSAEAKRYDIGPLFVELGARALGRTDLRAIAAPHLRRLRDASEETVTLHVRAGRQRVCVDGAESPHVIRRAALIGEVVSLEEGVTGRAILAFIDDPVASPVLAEVRRQGMASGTGERAPGVAVLAVPVFDATGVVAAITIGGPADRWTDRRIRAFAPVALEAADRVSRSLGAPVRSSPDRVG